MTTIDERTKCEKCGMETAVLEGVLRLDDKSGPTNLLARGPTEYLSEKLRLQYNCRNCRYQFEKTIHGLPKA